MCTNRSIEYNINDTLMSPGELGSAINFNECCMQRPNLNVCLMSLSQDRCSISLFTGETPVFARVQLLLGIAAR